MIDLHTHTLHSDGELLPTELARRARVIGYRALAITDHADESNIEELLTRISRVAVELNRRGDLKVVPGVELTHIPPARIPALVREARALGAGIVVGHGETIVEPVAPGTNGAYIRAGVDILAHPGLIGDREARLAASGGVHLEISARKGHCLGNGHVAATAGRHGIRLVFNTDAHSPGDLATEGFAASVVLGAGLTKTDFRKMQKNAETIVKKALA
ncbi:MAG: histidinol phosphate phosphatase domain-containing protein [Thermodesulfobacteriota bacterium]